jgi:DinB superfamily
MQTSIDRYRKIRLYILESIKDLSVEQLNGIPEGFSNNIIWNIAHLVATQQAICYKRAGQEIKIEESFFDLFKPGTKPDLKFDADMIQKIKAMFISNLDELEKDYNNNVFTTYTSWNTRAGVEITNIDIALNFILYHEGLHEGIIGALKKFVKQ